MWSDRRSVKRSHPCAGSTMCKCDWMFLKTKLLWEFHRMACPTHFTVVHKFELFRTRRSTKNLYSRKISAKSDGKRMNLSSQNVRWHRSRWNLQISLYPCWSLSVKLGWAGWDFCEVSVILLTSALTFGQIVQSWNLGEAALALVGPLVSHFTSTKKEILCVWMWLPVTLKFVDFSQKLLSMCGGGSASESPMKLSIACVLGWHGDMNTS